MFFSACQKAAPSPYSDPATNPNMATFSAASNGGPVSSYTPIKIIVGNYVYLRGYSNHRDIIISFPITLGTGHYTTGQNNVSGVVINGATRYVDKGSGILYISAINDGKYTATFDMIPSDSTNPSNDIIINQGTISNL